MQEAAGTAAAPSMEERDRFIPVRKTDILDALVEHGEFADESERGEFRQICRILGAIYHYEYFDRLEKLRDCYFYFSPELNATAPFVPAIRERAYAELVEGFTTVLKGANFVEVSHDEIERAHREEAEVRVAIRAPLDEFREVRFFRRGHHHVSLEVPRWFGWRRQTIDALFYDDVVLFVALKPDLHHGDRRKRGRNIPPGSVLIKYFRNIASADLNALFPNVRVVMSQLDKLVLTVPAIAGGIPILLNL